MLIFSVFGECSDTVGSFSCVCSDGYFGNGFNCTDIDECSNQIFNDCPDFSDCSNTVGSYFCTCQDGLTFNENGTECLDVDECENLPCHSQGRVLNFHTHAVGKAL